MVIPTRILFLFVLAGFAGVFGISCNHDDDDGNPATFVDGDTERTRDGGDEGDDDDVGGDDGGDDGDGEGGEGDGKGDVQLAFASGSGFTTASVSLGRQPTGLPSDVLGAGAGVSPTQQPMGLSFDVPVGAVVNQVVLYWDTPAVSPDATIVVDGVEVTGGLIREGARNLYRADITDVVPVAAGTGTLSLDGVDIGDADAGAAVTIIFDDGSGIAEQQFRDGSGRGLPDEEVVEDGALVHRFSVSPANVQRTANLASILSDGGVGGAHSVMVLADGEVALDSTLMPGEGYWDRLLEDLEIAPGTETMEVRVTPSDGGNPEDLWLISGLRFACTRKITGVFIDDLNQNGVQDEGEAGLEGVELTLESEDGETLATLTTDADGLYEFSGLCPGTYRIVVNPDTLPEGARRTDCTDDSDGTEEGRCDFFSDVTIDPDGDTDTDVNFSYTGPCTGSLGDLVWHDLNENGLFEAGEPGIAGVTVFLKRQENGVILDETETDRDGRYRFEEVCGGDYSVEVDVETLPPAFVPGICDAGDDTRDNDCSPANVSLEGNDASDVTVDFAYVSECSGEVFGSLTVDFDADGERGAAEPILEGVGLTIRDADGNRVADLTSGPGGFSFVGLCPGSYVVDVNLSTVRPGLDLQSCRLAEVISKDCLALPFEVGSDEGRVGPIEYFFGSGCTSEIRGVMFNDEDGDGLRRGEIGIGDVRVRVVLRGPDGDRVGESTTGFFGDYAFPGLCAGDYTIDIDPSTLPRGFEQATCFPAPRRLPQSTCIPADVTVTQDDGEVVIVSAGFTSEFSGRFLGRLVNDLNGDGVRDAESEPGIVGVRVSLRDEQGELVARFRSRPSGSFDLFGIAPGTYEVEVDRSGLPEGFAQVNCGEFQPGSLTSVCTPATIVIPETDEIVEVNFGFTQVKEAP